MSDRQKRHFEKLREQGHRRLDVILSGDVFEKLDKLSNCQRVTKKELISRLLDDAFERQRVTKNMQIEKLLFCLNNVLARREILRKELFERYRVTFISDENETWEGYNFPVLFFDAPELLEEETEL